jgi:hypothetical protein
MEVSNFHTFVPLPEGLSLGRRPTLVGAGRRVAYRYAVDARVALEFYVSLMRAGVVFYCDSGGHPRP